VKPLDRDRISLPGFHLVEASAGCGKTTALVDLYLRLLVETELEVRNILVVTYTRAATAELRRRVRARIERAASEASDDRLRARLDLAIHDFDEAAISTIHGFCQRTLLEHAFESDAPFDLAFLPDEGPLLYEIAADFWTRELYDAPEAFIEYLGGNGIHSRELATLARRAAQGPELPILPAAPEVEVERAFERWKEAWEAAGRIWRTDRDAVVRILTSSPSLKLNSYDPEKIRLNWVDAIDRMFSAPRVAFIARKQLPRLTPEGLRQGTKAKGIAPTHRFFSACGELESLTTALDEALEGRLLQLKLDLIAYARGELRSRKSVRREQSFDDLLERLWAALRGPRSDALVERLRARFGAALVDEFQDTDPTQYEIFRRIYGGTRHPVFLIGDPKQAIYAFRGADVFAYLDARREIGDRYALDTNWRSDPSLVRALNTVYARADRPFLFDEIEYAPVQPAPPSVDRWQGPPFRILFAPRAEGVRVTRSRIVKSWDAFPALVASDIARVLGEPMRFADGTPVAAADCAVLCRTNRQAAEMQGALRALGVASVLDGDSSVFDTSEAEEVERVLRAMLSPNDGRVVRAALATDLVGLTAFELATLSVDETAEERWLSRFESWNELLRTRGVVPAFRRMLDECAVYARVLELPDGERRLTNALHVLELLHVAAEAEHIGPNALVRWLFRMREDEKARAGLAGEAVQLRLESDERAVRITTMHKAKGLEYPLVWCPYLWDGTLLRGRDGDEVRFHDPDDGDRAKLDVGSADIGTHREQAERESLAENLRLLYVALTRARHLCTVVWGAFYSFETSALGYVLHQPPDDGSHRAVMPSVVQGKLREASDQALIAELERLAAASNGSIAIEPLPLVPARPLPFRGGESDLEEARRAVRRPRASIALTSFSALTRTSAEPAIELAPSDESFDDTDVSVARDPLDLPPGVETGLMVHEVLEHIDFACDDAAVSERGAAALVRYGLDAALLPALERMLHALLRAPLGHGFSLADIAPSKRRAEMGFVLPLRLGADRGLDGRALGELFLAHRFPRSAPEYGASLRRLEAEDVRGYLRGFIDLVFEHDGKWYVADYKTNDLGEYGPEPIARSMRGHDYYLQYALYVAAVDRFLATRLAGYDYGRSFGGVYYLFARGMGAGEGVYFDRPSDDFVRDLSRLLTPEGRS
jgi:exodeoxyribonuclease V beta subunit